MKKVISIFFTAFLIASPVRAEIQTYSDEYVTFQYDDEMIGKIMINSLQSFRSYSIYSGFLINDEISSSVSLRTGKSLTESFFDDSGSENIKIIITSKENCERDVIFTNNGLSKTSHQRMEIISEDSNILYSISCDESSPYYDYIKLFNDSFEIHNKTFSDENPLPIPQNEYGDIETVFSNMRYSEQAIIYAQKALDTCVKYLNMEITGQEASDIFGELEKRMESYMEVTEYFADSSIQTSILNEQNHFKNGKDAEIIKLKNELQEIIDSGTN